MGRRGVKNYATENRVVYANDTGKNVGFPPNVISNTKYTPFNFLFKNLAEQFSRFMNLYFLGVACLQLIRRITPVEPITTWAPLIFILALSAFKEAIDDLGRARADREANQAPVRVVRNGALATDTAASIQVGDMLYISKDQEFPADIVVVKTSEENGNCYIQTANLDGETDLKTRAARPETQALSEADILNFKGLIECKQPNPEIYKFDSRMKMRATDREFMALKPLQAALQATHLRNTDWVYGVVVYTGNETKVGMNKRPAPTKWTKLDKAINKTTMFVFFCQFVILSAFGARGLEWKNANGADHVYLQYPAEADPLDWIIIPARFFLLMTLMIPISLKVSLDIAKLFYARFINWDNQMWDDEFQVNAHATNTAISEDLGQIEHVFTDKTGTLTENIMAFKKASIAGILYGGETPEGDATEDKSLTQAVAGGDETHVQFFRCLSLCHTIVPEEREDGTVEYKASSPDEEALVKAAGKIGAHFHARTGKVVSVRINGTDELHEELAILEFSSDRKRMSVVTRSKVDGVIRIWIKGADDKIFERLAPGQDRTDTTLHLEAMAGAGLRTLVIGYRVVTEGEFLQWEKEFKAAETAVDDRQKRLEAVQEKIERDFLLLGATAIEDKLQAQVPETIATLREAGLRFWMLTGDKYATAVQIATSCNLLTPAPNGMLIPIVGGNPDDVNQSVLAAMGDLKRSTNVSVTVIIEGHTLEHALVAPARPTFLKLGLLANAVICCRVTPQQKADVVGLVKENGNMTLSIGDGGNDVVMIQEAHIGVGLVGREGLQAARAADYSIGKFRFLKRLMLIHGRYSYMRTSFIAQYSFYKSVFIALTNVFFAVFSGYSGASFYNSISLTLYNTFLTGLPPIAYVLDKDIPEDTVERSPQVYSDGQNSRFYNIKTFMSWFGRGVVQGISLLFLIQYMYDPTFMTSTGRTYDAETVSLVMYSVAILLQYLTIALDSHSFTWINHLIIWGSMVFYGFYGWTTTTSAWANFSVYRLYEYLAVEPSSWLVLILLLSVMLLPVLAAKYIAFEYLPSSTDVIRKIESVNREIKAAGDSDPEAGGK